MNDLLESSKVERIGKGVYRIRSQTQPGLEYTVDVLDNDGLGGCDCKNFLLSLLPKYERSVRVPSDKFRCKHLKRVRQFVLDVIIQGAINKETKK